MAGVSTPDAAVDQWMNIDFTRERILFTITIGC